MKSAVNDEKSKHRMIVDPLQNRQHAYTPTAEGKCRRSRRKRTER